MLYRAIIKDVAASEGVTAATPLSRRGDNGDPRGDTSDGEGVTPMSPKHPVNTKSGTHRTKLSGQDVRTRREAIEGALDDSDLGSLYHELVDLDGISDDDCKWILVGMQRAQAEGMLAIADANTHEIVTTAIADMFKPPGRFKRSRFLTFVESALRVRCHANSFEWVDDAAFAREIAWPLN